MKLDEKLKLKLTFCKEHKRNIFCAWSKDETKNLCYFEIGEHLANNKNYELFMDIYPDIEFKEDTYLKVIDSLKILLKKYLIESPKSVKDINYLNDIIFIIENSLYLFLNEKIFNYQTIKNTLFSIKIMPSEKEMEYFTKKILINIYEDFIIETTSKDVKDIDIKEINSDIKDIIEEIKLYFKEDIKIIPYILDEKQIFLVLNNKTSQYIWIYQKVGNDLLNKKVLEKTTDFEVIMVYNEKLIILLEDTKLFLVPFSEGLNKDEISSLNLKNYINDNNHNLFYDDLFDDDFIPYENQLIKINNNQIILL